MKEASLASRAALHLFLKDMMQSRLWEITHLSLPIVLQELAHDAD